MDILSKPEEKRPSMLGQFPPMDSVFKDGKAEWIAQIVAWYLVDQCNDQFQVIEDTRDVGKWLGNSLQGSSPQAEKFKMMMTLFGAQEAADIFNRLIKDVSPHLATAEAAAAFSETWMYLLYGKQDYLSARFLMPFLQLHSVKPIMAGINECAKQRCGVSPFEIEETYVYITCLNAKIYVVFNILHEVSQGIIKGFDLSVGAFLKEIMDVICLHATVNKINLHGLETSIAKEETPC